MVTTYRSATCEVVPVFRPGEWLTAADVAARLWGRTKIYARARCNEAVGMGLLMRRTSARVNHHGLPYLEWALPEQEGAA